MSEATQGPLKVAWCLTGSGDLMPETVAAMTAVSETLDVQITAALSKAAERVVRWYKLMDVVEALARKVMIEKDANDPFIAGLLQIKRYDCLVVAPLTANSTAKIAHGIADTLVTNSVAQTAKTDVPIYLLPVDQREGTTVTTRPGGERLELSIRAVDIENARRLTAMEGITVIEGPGDIDGALRACGARPLERA